MTVDGILQGHTIGVRQIAQRLRNTVAVAMPDAVERVYAGWHALGYRHPQAGYVCGIFPYEDHVRLIFERGAQLPDPDGILEGEALKQVRYVRLFPEAAFPQQQLTSLIRSALHHGVLRRTTR